VGLLRVHVVVNVVAAEGGDSSPLLVQLLLQRHVVRVQGLRLVVLLSQDLGQTLSRHRVFLSLKVLIQRLASKSCIWSHRSAPRMKSKRILYCCLRVWRCNCDICVLVPDVVWSVVWNVEGRPSGSVHATLLGETSQDSVLVVLRLVVQVRVEQVSQPLVLVFQLCNHSVLVVDLVHKTVSVRLQLIVHALSRIQLISA
jgi:hypothetical protein